MEKELATLTTKTCSAGISGALFFLVFYKFYFLHYDNLWVCCPIFFYYLYLLSGDVEVSLGSSHTNWGTREGHKLLSGRYW